MPRIPKKNISGVLSDIKPPADGRRIPAARHGISAPPKRAPSPRAAFSKSVRAAPVPIAPRRFRVGRLFTLAALGLLLAVGAYAALLYSEKGSVYSSARAVAESFRDSIRFLSEFKPGEAKRSLESADQELKDLRSLGDRYALWGLTDAAGKLWPTLALVPRAFRLVETLTRSAIGVADGADRLKTNGMSYFTSGQGDVLIGEIRKVRTNIEELRGAGEELTVLKGDIGSLVALPLPSDYLMWNTELRRTEEFLDGVLALLGAPAERHILLLFHNPSEMRPSGGFIGSYADVTIERGAMKLLDVRDIYDPDGQLDEKVIPPKPLQAITTSWGARDANWFFDFPTSAQKVFGFLEASKMYKERNVTFEGAIAVNTDVLSSMLELVGPIELPSYDLTLDAENFLVEVQKEVEAGESKRVGEPKRILRDAAPILLERLAMLPEAGKRALALRAAAHLERGDIAFFFRDPLLQNFFTAHRLAGAVADLPQPFFGDYFAVVNGNVAGGKTDIYMRQEVTVRSAIDLQGSVKTDATVKRTHTGASARYSWYRATNQNYLRLLVAPDIKLVSLSGETPKTVRAPINYEKNNYRADPDVVELETNERESGKKAIGAWLSVKAGTTGTLRVRYENPVPMALTDGAEFTVILEEQPGVRGSIRYELEAPPGYVWRETDDARYVYESEDPPKRVTVVLTLEKI